jgi:DNA-directed RNA polymerase specialized sigma24 family protein
MRLHENRFLDRLSEQRLPDLRDAKSALLERAAHLLPADRRLVELAIRNQLTQRQLADLFSVPPGTVSRRFRRAINRLCDPLVVALLEPACPFPPDHRQLALEHWLHGLSRRQLCRKHEMSLTQVHRMLEFVRGWHRASLASPSARPWRTHA